MSTQQKQSWSIGAVVAVAALCLQLGVLLIAGGRRTQQIDTLLLLSKESHDANEKLVEMWNVRTAEIHSLQSKIEILQRQVLELHVKIADMLKRLEDKKVVSEVTPTEPISAGKKPIVKTL